MCPIQILDPMRSRAGQKVKPRFFNGPPKTEIEKRIELRVVGGFLSVQGHRDLEQGGKTFPCLGGECVFCRRQQSPEPYEYIGALLNGHADTPVTWCVPPDWSHQLGEQPWRWLVFTTWVRRDGTVRIERSRKAAVVIDYPEIDVWTHCLESWRLTEAQVGPRPTYQIPDAEPEDLILSLPQDRPVISREEYERVVLARRERA